jgi:type IV pilus assembly protein PilP
VTLAVAALIAGCSASNDYQDIKAFMDEVDARGKGQIEPLPEFLPYQAFAYGAGSMRSPFEPPVVVKPVDPNKKTALVKPDPNRVKQFLEQFNIGAIAMVGTLSQAPVCLVSSAIRVAAATGCRWETTWDG